MNAIWQRFLTRKVDLISADHGPWRRLDRYTAFAIAAAMAGVANFATPLVPKGVIESGSPTNGTSTSGTFALTGDGLVSCCGNDEPRILLAEIYPSLVPLQDPQGRVKDQAQVETFARHVARLEADDVLGALFQAPSQVEPQKQRVAVEVDRTSIRGRIRRLRWLS